MSQKSAWASAGSQSPPATVPKSVTASPSARHRSISTNDVSSAAAGAAAAPSDFPTAGALGRPPSSSMLVRQRSSSRMSFSSAGSLAASTMEQKLPSVRMTRTGAYMSAGTPVSPTLPKLVCSCCCLLLYHEMRLTCGAG